MPKPLQPCVLAPSWVKVLVMKQPGLVVLAGLLVVAVSACSGGGQGSSFSESDWPTFGHDNYHTRANTAETEIGVGEWQKQQPDDAGASR